MAMTGKTTDKLNMVKLKYNAKLVTIENKVQKRFNSYVDNDDLGIFIISENKDQAVSDAALAVSMHCAMYSIEEIDRALSFLNANPSRKARPAANILIPAVR